MQREGCHAMMTSRTSVEAMHASRYLQQLCKHWSHKFQTDISPVAGTISLPAGTVKLAADEATLAVELSAEDEAAIERLESVVAEHLKRFTFREELVFVWRRSDA